MNILVGIQSFVQHSWLFHESVPLCMLIRFWNAIVALLASNAFLILPNTLNGDDARYIPNTDTGETAEAFTTVIWNHGLL